MRGVLVGWWLTPAALFMGAEQSSFEQGDALRVGKHTHYAILGLDANNFDEKALKKHYRALALKWHPGLAAAWAFVCVLAARGHGYPCGNRHAAAGWTACT